MVIGIIANPHAGKAGKDIPHLARVKGAELHLAVTTRLDQIRDALELFATKQVEVIGVYGGDGTLQQVLTTHFAVFNAPPPPILLLRGGSMNIVTYNYHSDGDPVKLVKRLVKHGYQKHSHLLMRVSSEAHWRPSLPIYGSIFSLGAVTELLKWYYNGESGLVRAVHTSLHGIAAGLGLAQAGVDISRQKMKIRLDGKGDFEESFVLNCLASTVGKLIFKMTPFPKPPTPEQFAWLAYAIEPRECVTHLLPILFGAPPVNDPRYQHGTAATLEIMTTRDFTVDGELFANLDPRGSVITLERGPTISFAEPKSKEVIRS